MTETRATTDPVAQAWRGSVMLAAGGALAVVTWWLRTASPQPVARYLPYLLLLAGAYVAITGIEKLASAWQARNAPAEEAQRAALRRALAAGSAVLILVAAGAAAVWLDRAPYWRSVRGLGAGDKATETLRSLAEKHAAKMQAGTSGEAAVASWRTTATEALQLKASFAQSLEAARYLAREASGSVKQRADEDTIFYGLCMEWMELYENVLQETDGVSMVEPSPYWVQRQEAIIERIQQLPSAGSSR